jgi:hypothetical protein
LQANNQTIPNQLIASHGSNGCEIFDSIGVGIATKESEG